MKAAQARAQVLAWAAATVGESADLLVSGRLVGGQMYLCAAAGVGLVLSSRVGRPSRALQRRRWDPVVEAAHWGLLIREMTARGCAALRANPVSAVSAVSADVRCQTWCCESGFHQSRSPLSIPFREKAGCRKMYRGGAEQGWGWRNDEYTVGESWCTGSDVVLVKWAVSKAVMVVVLRPRRGQALIAKPTAGAD